MAKKNTSEIKKGGLILVILATGSIVLILVLVNYEDSAVSSSSLFLRETSKTDRSCNREENPTEVKAGAVDIGRLGTSLQSSDYAKSSAWTISITGKVQYSDGQPVAKARMECAILGMTDGIPKMKVQIEADEEGKFYLSDVEPGRFVFTTSDANDWTLTKTEFGEAGRTHNVLICLRAKATLAGEVFDEEFRPIENAEVYLWMGKSSLPKQGWPIPLDMTLHTDMNGHFDFGKVPPNTVKVLIKKNGYESMNYPYIELTEGKPFRLSVKLKKGSYLTGIVRINPAFMPDPGSSLHLDRYVSVGLIQREIGKDGEDDFEVTHLTELRPTAEDGSFSIEITSFHPETMLLVRARGHRPRRIPIEIKQGENKNVEVVLTEKGGVFSGKIKRAEDSKAVKVRIHLSYIPKNQEELEDFDISFEVGDDGLFQVDYLDIKEYSASITFEYPGTPYQKTISRVFTPNAEGVVFNEPLDRD